MYVSLRRYTIWFPLGILIPVFLLVISRNIYILPDQKDQVQLLLFTAVFIASFLPFLFLFRRKRPDNPGSMPYVSVIIPVKNEEKNIYNVLVKIWESGYTDEKLEIIIINDGSEDSTLVEIRKFINNYRSIILINNKKSIGKRESLIKGIRVSKGEVIVFLDSDTFIKKNSLRKLVGGLKGKTVACCGETLVHNKYQNLLTRLQHYDFFISFNYFKSFENNFGYVTACPGCFSAYRRDILLEILPQWKPLNIFGSKLDYGEDRVLTYLLLKNYSVAYCREAQAETIVPETLKSFFFQRMRWAKSWLVVSLLMAGRLTWKNPLVAYVYYAMFIGSYIAWISLLGSFTNFAGVVSLNLNVIGFLLCWSLHLSICFWMREYKMALYSLPFMLFFLLCIIWIIPLAVMTIEDNHWGSRSMKFN